MMHMLYVDGHSIDRTGTSSQQSRLVKLTDVLPGAPGSRPLVVAEP